MYKDDWDNGKRKEYVKYSPKGKPNYAIRGGNNRLSIPIVQLTKDGEFVKLWESGGSIRREMNFNNSAICICCKNPNLTRYGYKWMYAKDYYVP